MQPPAPSYTGGLENLKKKEKVRKKLEFPKHDIFEVIFGTLTPVSGTSGNTLYTAIKRKSLFPLSFDSRFRYCFRRK